jgi:hypothetical protein
MEWITGNLRDLFEIGLAIHGVAVLIVNLTPTPKDDEAVASAGAALRQSYRIIEILAGVVTPLVKR